MQPACRALKPRAFLDPLLGLVRQADVHRAVVLMGSRRVGKTVLLHQIISQLLDAHRYEPREVAYIQLGQPLYTRLSIEDVAHEVCEASGSPQGPRVLVLDDIQYLADWEQHLNLRHPGHPRTEFVIRVAGPQHRSGGVVGGSLSRLRRDQADAQALSGILGGRVPNQGAPPYRPRCPPVPPRRSLQGVRNRPGLAIRIVRSGVCRRKSHAYSCRDSRIRPVAPFEPRPQLRPLARRRGRSRVSRPSAEAGMVRGSQLVGSARGSTRRSTGN